jgi:hypothetical protein
LRRQPVRPAEGPNPPRRAGAQSTVSVGAPGRSSMPSALPARPRRRLPGRACRRVLGSTTRGERRSRADAASEGAAGVEPHRCLCGNARAGWRSVVGGGIHCRCVPAVPPRRLRHGRGPRCFGALRARGRRLRLRLRGTGWRVVQVDGPICEHSPRRAFRGVWTRRGAAHAAAFARHWWRQRRRAAPRTVTAGAAPRRRRSSRDQRPAGDQPEPS